MILLVAVFAGIAGGCVGFLAGAGWFFTAVLFGFPSPTPDQIGALAGLLSVIGSLGTWIFIGIVWLCFG